MIEQTAKEGRAMSDPPLALAMDNAFWDFSCAVYAAPGVRERSQGLHVSGWKLERPEESMP